MTQEDKELLFKDLCARLPYGVKCKDWTYDENDEPVDTIRILGVMDSETKCYKYRRIYAEHNISRIKPYLRPMSSMTEKERNEYLSIKMQECERVALAEVNRPEAIVTVIDWLNAHHFDYRGLINKGLAEPATEGMYGPIID